MASKTYYVSGTGSDNNNGLKEGTAFRSLGRAVYQMKTGDTLYVMNGNYDKGVTLFNFNGSANNWTTIKAYPGATPTIKTTKSGINIFSSSYVRIEGLDIEGNRKNITLAYALQEKNNPDNPLTNSDGISVKPWKNSQGAGGTTPHHIVISGNTVSNFPGNGITSSDSDYITVEKNVVSGNGWYSPYGTQGITTLHAVNSDNNTTDYKIIYRDNIVFNNKSLVPWKEAGKITEGHGLMLDTTNQSRDGKPYLGKTLIANNIVYNNGNSGIGAFKAKNVDIVNNTVYKNSLVLANTGEIKVNYSENVKVDNNIMYASDNQVANLLKYDKNVNFDHNLIYNSNVFRASDNLKATGLHNILGIDPQFVDAGKGNFALKPGSAAIDAGSNAFNSITKNIPQDGDDNGTAVIDIGAYEVPHINDLNNNIVGFDNFNDVIDGQGGNDTINGYAGNDQLRGGTGNDLLIGGQGNDLLVGGMGADSFLYGTNAAFTSAAVGIDTIADFNHSQGDKIVLDKTTFSAISSAAGTGFSNGSNFQITSLGALSNAAIVYDPMTGRLSYNQNGSAAGFGSGGQFAQLTGAPTLTASDFIIQA
ncbi:choice-of-anchor Q domain-containing protein [Nostoc sp.]|uniref:choice-of-anchor Q domain-containing protein n=1 Tax=Nostoc sp. TaxID=1180 RepID=UPI002FF731B1